MTKRPSLSPAVEPCCNAAMLYFAYGSNLQKRHFARLCPAARPVGPSRLEGFRLVFRFFADIEPSEGGAVPGALWRITPACERALDAYENLASGLYVKLGATVDEPGGGSVEAMTYRMVRTDYERPDPAYLAMIHDGYADFGLDAAGLDAAAGVGLPPD